MSRSIFAAINCENLFLNGEMRASSLDGTPLAAYYEQVLRNVVDRGKENASSFLGRVCGAVVVGMQQ